MRVFFKPKLEGFHEIAGAYYEFRLEIHNKGFSDSDIFGPSQNASAVYVMRRGKIIGFIIYYLTTTNDYYIQGSYVKPEYRCKGVYGALWADLVRRAKKNDVKGIEGGTHVKNKAMLATYKKYGREKTFQISYYKVR